MCTSGAIGPVMWRGSCTCGGAQSIEIAAEPGFERRIHGGWLRRVAVHAAWTGRTYRLAAGPVRRINPLCGSCMERAGAAIVALSLTACGGGASPAYTGVASYRLPIIGPVTDSTARAAVQARPAREQAAIVLAVTVTGDPNLFGRQRRTAVRMPERERGCNGGSYEVDTPESNGNVHQVVSLYFDAAAVRFGRRRPFDRSLGVDTSSSIGTIVSYDVAGHVTAVETVNDSTSASGGGFATRQWTDAAAASAAAAFGHASLFWRAIRRERARLRR